MVSECAGEEMRECGELEVPWRRGPGAGSRREEGESSTRTPTEKIASRALFSVALRRPTGNHPLGLDLSPQLSKLYLN